MLLERITYADDFPINVTVATIVEDPLHYHVDIEFIYVLKGEVQLKNGYCHYTLREGDIFTNSGHEVHSLTALTPDNVVAQIQISTHHFSRYFPNLSKACYRTYSKTPTDKKHDRLRGLMLQLLLKHALKSFHYKTECVCLMVDAIKHLDKYFNLFALDKDVVVGFDRGNPVAIERISRICAYIYQYYADNITLEDISAMEHLSPFYLSHLIKSFTGMSFRDFLCLARVEWSEIRLLESDSKISQIARDVGFSTTAYYEKYFQKWFKCSPQEHRAAYLPLIKSDLRPAVLEPLPQDDAVALIKSAHANYNLKQGDGGVLASLSLELNVSTNAPALFRLDRQIGVRLTLEDYQVQGLRLFEALDSLSPAKVILMTRETDPPEELRPLARLLRSGGFSVEQRPFQDRSLPSSAVRDSIAYAVHLLKEQIRPDKAPLELDLRDAGQPGALLQGQAAVLTANGVKKPSFFAYQFLSLLRGEVLAQNPQYCVIRGPGPAFVVLAYNTSDSLQALCQDGGDLQQTKTLLNDFTDEINISVNLDLRPGMYSVTKYSLDAQRNIFACMADLGFQDWAFPRPSPLEAFSCPPTVEVYLEDVRTVLSLSLSIRGAGIQMAVIHPR